jgi:hypothetical protein
MLRGGVVLPLKGGLDGSDVPALQPTSTQSAIAPKTNEALFIGELPVGKKAIAENDPPSSPVLGGKKYRANAAFAAGSLLMHGRIIGLPWPRVPDTRFDGYDGCRGVL